MTDETQTFTCKIGVNARAYFDIEIEAASPDEALAKIREMAKDGITGSEAAADVSFDYEVDDRECPALIYIRDEDEEDHHELVDLDPTPAELTAKEAEDLRSSLQRLLDDMHDADETHSADGSMFDSVEAAAKALTAAGGSLAWYTPAD